MTTGLYPGCVAPVKTVLIVESDDAAFDLANVTAAVIVAVFADNSESEWAATLSAQSSASVTLTRLHAAADVPIGAEGHVYLRAKLTTTDSVEPLETTARPVPIIELGAS